jgi:peroxiredoxin
LALPRFRERGASLASISPQTAPNSRASQENNRLTYPILSDPQNAVAEKFGVRFRLPDYLIEVYQKLKNDLPMFNGDTSWTLPMPSRFVIGQDGVTAYAEVNPDYRIRPDPEVLLPILDPIVTSRV